jgi:hypothetical protein
MLALADESDPKAECQAVVRQLKLVTGDTVRFINSTVLVLQLDQC